MSDVTMTLTEDDMSLLESLVLNGIEHLKHRGFGDSRTVRDGWRVTEAIRAALAAAPRPADYVAVDGLGHKVVVPGNVTFEPPRPAEEADGLDDKPYAGMFWVIGGYGPCRIETCPDCGMGMDGGRAVQPNHCPQCGHLWQRLPWPCPVCGKPEWPDGHDCPANPSAKANSAAMAQAEGSKG